MENFNQYGKEAPLNESILVFSNTTMLCRDGLSVISCAVEDADFEIIGCLIKSGYPVLNLRGMKHTPVVTVYKLKKCTILDCLLGKINVVSRYHFELMAECLKNEPERLSIL